jgi:hypothetical protein
MSTVGRVSVGFISIELRAVTGEVSSKIVDGTRVWQVSVPAGQTVDVSYEQGLFERHPKLGPFMEPYDQVSVFSGVRTGKDVNIIAIANHTQGALNTIPQPFNNMIVPGAGKSTHSPLYNFLAIVAIFTAVFSVLGLFMGKPEGIVFLVPALAFFWWIRKRQKKLRKAIEDAAARLKPRATAPNGEAPTPAAVRI